MQTYASKYINITNMNSELKEEFEDNMEAAFHSNLKKACLCGDNFLLEFVHLNDGYFDQEEEPNEDDDPEYHVLRQYICEGVGEERTDEQPLVGKVIAWRADEMDVSRLIPNFEPQICLFMFEDFTYHNSPRVFEMYVREDYLKSPAGREFGEEVMRAKLKGEIV